MNFVPVKTPSIIKRLFSSYVWDVDTNDNIVYLTFDDGPTPEITDWTLELLKQYNAQATFFCIGNNIEKSPEVFEKIILDNHVIGNHTYNHVKGWKTDEDTYVNEVLKTQECIDSMVRRSEIDNQQSAFVNRQSKITNLFRPPYGQITTKQGKRIQKLGYKIIMWDVLAFDWNDSVSNVQCYENVISKSKPGSIIVFHDSIKASEHLQYALPKVLDYFSEKGFEFRGIPE